MINIGIHAYMLTRSLIPVTVVGGSGHNYDLARDLAENQELLQHC